MKQTIPYQLTAGLSILLMVTQMIFSSEIDSFFGFSRAHGVTIVITAAAILAAVELVILKWTRASRQQATIYQHKVKLFHQVSHEFRTPLSSIIAYTDILRGIPCGDEEAKQQYLRIIDNEADKMSDLVEDMLSLARTEAEGDRRTRGEVNLQEQLQSVWDALRPFADKAAVSVRFDIEPNLPTIYGEPATLRSVALNLVENAIKYNYRNGNVDVKLEPAEAGLLFTVADKGPGIPPDSLPHIFDEFYRAPEIQQIGIPGSGLGLSIVKHIVNAHGGYIEVESSLGHGSTFRVFLPRGLRRVDRRKASDRDSKISHVTLIRPEAARKQGVDPIGKVS